MLTSLQPHHLYKISHAWAKDRSAATSDPTAVQMPPKYGTSCNNTYIKDYDMKHDVPSASFPSFPSQVVHRY